MLLMRSRNLFLVLNLPQNKFHKNSLKTEKNHNKFSSQINVRNYHSKQTLTVYHFWLISDSFVIVVVVLVETNLSNLNSKFMKYVLIFFFVLFSGEFSLQSTVYQLRILGLHTELNTK